MNFVFYIFIFLLGLCVGSFLNCVIYRLEQKKKMTARSYCVKCKKQLKWQDLFPVFSFLFLRGRCRYCKKSISLQYPVVELTTGVLFLLIFNHSTERFALVLGLSDYSQIIASVFNFAFLFYVASALIIIFVYDLKHYIIPDKILLPAIGITLVYRLFENFSLLGNYLFAALIASGFFLAIFLISKGRWMGFGDVKLAVLMGLLLGIPDILVALFIAFFFGAIIGLILIVFKGTPLEVRGSRGGSFKSRLLTGLKSEIPFGPFLIAGTFIAILWSSQIINWYLNII